MFYKIGFIGFKSPIYIFFTSIVLQKYSSSILHLLLGLFLDFFLHIFIYVKMILLELLNFSYYYVPPPMCDILKMSWGKN